MTISINQFKKWLEIIGDFHETMKLEISNLYKLKEDLDQELSTLYVEKLERFYKQLLHTYNNYSIESPTALNLQIRGFQNDITKLMSLYSELKYFSETVEDFTGVTLQYSDNFQNVLWLKLKNRYIADFNPS